MCGRYTVYSSPEEFADYFSATLQYSFGKSYNLAPTSIVPVLLKVENERIILPMRWGLIPAWHNEQNKITVLNNAKIETIDTKPSFRTPFKRQRCLILANGFYEWDSTTKPKQPYYFHPSDNRPIALAGIWDRWVTQDKTIDSCAIITEEANALVSTVHDRMPGIITPEDYSKWLDNQFHDVSQIKEMAMRANAYSHMTRYPVTTEMNKVAFNSEACIERISR